MLLQVDGETVTELLPWHQTLLRNEILSAELTQQMKDRAQWIWEHKVERAFQRLQREWIPRLEADPAVTTIPLSQEEFVNLVTARPDYQDRDART